MADLTESPLESCSNRLAQTEDLTAERWRSILRSLCRWTKLSEELLVEGFVSALDDNGVQEDDGPGEKESQKVPQSPPASASANELTQPQKPTSANRSDKPPTSPGEPGKQSTLAGGPDKPPTPDGGPDKQPAPPADEPSKSDMLSTLSVTLSASDTRSEEQPAFNAHDQSEQHTASSTLPKKLHTSSTPLQQPTDTESKHPSLSVTQQQASVSATKPSPDALATDADDHLGVDQKISNVTQRKTCTRRIISTCGKITVPLLTVLVVLLALSVAIDKKRIGLPRLENFFLQNPESAELWASLNKQSVRILVTGKTGTGKSALINGLVGKNVTAEGDELDPKTSEVAQFKQMVHGISLSIFDSPGLQDGTEREEEYLRDMERKCAKVDLVLYTIKMTDQRVYASDTDAMEKITDAFGHKFWEKAIFVMTFANEVRSPEYPKDELENEKYFESRLQLWREKLPEYFKQRCGIPADIGRHIPIVPAGYYKIRDLPGRKYWFSLFWQAALNRLMESNMEGASYMLKFSQDRFKKVENMTEQDFEKPIHEQPILSPNIN